MIGNDVNKFLTDDVMGECVGKNYRAFHIEGNFISTVENVYFLDPSNKLLCCQSGCFVIICQPLKPRSHVVVTAGESVRGKSVTSRRIAWIQPEN